MSKFSIRKKIIKPLSNSSFGHEFIYQAKKLTGRLPDPDYNFPQHISLEISSLCNLACVHCPPQSREFKEHHRQKGNMDIQLFNKVMDEIDQQGSRHIALHKDGEPLLHPETSYILQRVKKNQNHTVYLTTNAHRLTPKIGNEILDNQINVVNFSIGAYSGEFYNKVRGRGFDRVMENIHGFLDLVTQSEWQPEILVQIINLPEYDEMQDEIKNFKKYWSDYKVGLQIWDKLNWGVYDINQTKIKRYPCYSLWKYIFVNSDGKASACCMDWKQDLIIGNANKQSLSEIWKESQLKELRQKHINGQENTLPICDQCNYWSWLPKISNYKI
ncbi:MAG: SPASM domain-containing protein [Calditrichaceae bacterium]